MPLARPDARERRTLALGGTIIAAALLAAFVLAPAFSRWREREAAITVQREKVARLQGLLEHSASLQATVAVQGVADGANRVVRGRTASLAASTLQTMLQDLARVSSVSVTRLDVGSTTDSTSQILSASLSATTDIYGVADLLTRLQTAPYVVGVTELSVVPNPVLRGNLLQVSVTVRAPWMVDS